MWKRRRMQPTQRGRNSEGSKEEEERGREKVGELGYMYMYMPNLFLLPPLLFPPIPLSSGQRL